MKTQNIYTWLLMGLSTAFFACNDDVPPYEELTDSKEGAAVFIAKAHDGHQHLTIFPYTDERSVQFGVGFGAVGLPASDIGITLAEDLQAFDSLNVIRELNGLPPYERFPQGAYQIDKLNLTIPKGGLSSDLTTLTYMPEAFDPETDYLLPLSIESAAGYSINPATKTIFFIAPKLQERRANTSGWVGTASSEQDNGWENTGLASALLDGDLNTIWHSQYSPARPGYPHWLSFEMPAPTYVTKVAVAPRQNNANGPTKLKLEGSADGTTWFDLSDELEFDPSNKSFQEYPIEAQYLQKIRLNLLEGGQDVSFLAEFAVYTY